jgi:hypothetical protein
MRITNRLLREKGACHEQRREFRSIFQDGCEPTVYNLTALANHLFMPDGQCHDETCWCNQLRLLDL